jgi:hypothetical protein
MSELSYSNEALNVISAFYGAERMLYVEGDDDVVFWEFMIEKFGRSGFKVQSLGGVKELKKFVNKIASGEIEAAAARDSDFTMIDPVHNRPDKVAYTYGHSIENTVIDQVTICKTVKAYGRLPKRLIDEAHCIEWLQSFHVDFEDMVVLDAGNELAQLGVAVLGLNCTKFMVGDKSSIPDPKKISKALSLLQSNDDLVLAGIAARSSIFKSSRVISDFMRGHFLLSAGLKYVNKMLEASGSSKSVSNDAFFSNTFMAFEAVFNQNHPHYGYYEQQVSRL